MDDCSRNIYTKLPWKRLCNYFLKVVAMLLLISFKQIHTACGLEAFLLSNSTKQSSMILKLSTNILLWDVPHWWMVLFVHIDWLVQKWLANTIHLQADGETKLCINNLISDHFYYTDKKLTNFLVSMWYVLKLLFFSVSLIVVDISSLYFATLWLGKYPLLFTYFSGNNC